MNGAWLEFIALVINIIVIAIFIFKKQARNEEVTIYKYLIIFSLLFSLNSLFSCLIKTNITTALSSISQKFNGVFFLIILFLFTWYSFTISKMTDKTKKSLFYLFLSFLVIISTLILLIPVNIKYHLKISDMVSFFTRIGEIFYFLSIIIFTIWHFISQKKYNKGLPLLVLILLFGCLLFFNYLQLKVVSESYIIAFTLLAMFFTLEKDTLREEKDISIEKVKKPLENILQLGKDISIVDNLNTAKDKALKVIDYSNEALEVVNGKKDVEKIVAEKSNECYDLENFFTEIIGQFEVKIKEKGLEFSYNITPDLPKEVFGDKESLRKIIANLIDNACKFTDTGYVHLEINCVNTADNCRLIIAIEDSGCGIKEDDVNKIFENNTSLAATKQLVESLNGRIIVHTIYKEGSKFSVVVNQKIISKGTTSMVMSDNFVDVNYEDLKVIVVDDNADNLKIIKKLLERFLIKDVIYLDNGYDLIEKMKDNYKCDVILLDIKMPNISGLDTFYELKKIKNFSIPVVALLANERPGEEQKYIDEGFFAYLMKPIQKDNLTKILEKISQVKDNNINDSDNQEIIEPPSIDAKEYLKKKGVAIDSSLELLGDLEMYNDTLKDFLAEVDEKWMNIEKYKLEGNMSEYAVLVHSLKSDCKYLGFMKLADISYQHELSSKANDSNFVNKNFKELEEEFNKVLSIAKDYEERYLN